uniref:Candidate secreted effector n=1 Tax=Meloidogyne incognita TaxID=6306 RepID=A0A914KH78_MELIC
MVPPIAIVFATLFLVICIVAVFAYLCYRRYMNSEKTILVNTELTLSSEGENNG